MGFLPLFPLPYCLPVFAVVVVLVVLHGLLLDVAVVVALFVGFAVMAVFVYGWLAYIHGKGGFFCAVKAFDCAAGAAHFYGLFLVGWFADCVHKGFF